MGNWNDVVADLENQIRKEYRKKYRNILLLAIATGVITGLSNVNTAKRETNIRKLETDLKVAKGQAARQMTIENMDDN